MSRVTQIPITITLPEGAPVCCCGEVVENPCEGGWCTWYSIGDPPGSGENLQWYLMPWERFPCNWGGGDCACGSSGTLAMLATIDVDAYPEYTLLYIRCYPPYSWAINDPNLLE